jgi:Tfp pilus assembly protein PilF
MVRAELAAKDLSGARRRIEALLAGDLADEIRGEALSLWGDILDALELPKDAFTVWRGRQALLLRARSPQLAQQPLDYNIQLARRLAAWFRKASPADWRPCGSTDGQGPAIAGHVFLLSFPRSGATLLEQMLGSHPGVAALDESLALAQATDHYMADDARLGALSRITPEEADACRKAYWDRVRLDLPRELDGLVFVDKNPLNSLRLPMIAKLFPDARILFAARDPRDVVLSCWRRLYFSLILEFMTIEGTAAFYGAVMDLVDVCKPLLSLPIYEVRHERLVADFEHEVIAALRFIGLDWDAAVADFAHAPIHNVTPSAAQIRRGLDSRLVAQWRPYAAELAALGPELDAWAVRFGYGANPALAAAVPGASPPPPDQLAATLNEVQRTIQAGQLPQAMALCDAALTRGLVHPLFHRLRGVKAQQVGQLDLAIADFEAALALGGEDAAVLNALGLCLARAGRAAEGLERLDRAIALAPGAAPHHYNRGWALEALGELAAARAAYARALDLDPAHVQATAGLANLAARAGNWDQAREQALGVLAREPQQPVASLALARAELAQGDGAGAERRLSALLATQRPSRHERAVALSVLGDALDRLDRRGEAFAAYAAAAAELRSLYGARFGEGVERTSAFARRLEARFAQMDPRAWTSAPATSDEVEGCRTHVFLLGFPRSGTTMLGQALAGHPDVTTLDERQMLIDASQAFLRPHDGPDRLANLRADEADHYRALYWARVREAGVEPRGRVFVDKLPMNVLGLPLIAKLFPKAKVLFLRRDPRDVVFSCFRHQFALDATTVEFLRLDGAAGLYDATMSLARLYGGLLPLDMRPLSYEALIGDFEAGMGEICDYLGLDFAADMLDFAHRSGDVATPSSSQLAAGLSGEGVGAWRRYADKLAPVLPKLEPWVELFGYGA